MNYMSENVGIAKNYLNAPQFKEQTKHFWTDLTETLNELGPPIKNTDGWKKVREFNLRITTSILMLFLCFKVWKDFKYNIKNKLRNNKLNVHGTGGGPNRKLPLSPLEEVIVQLLDLNQSVEGMCVA